MIVNYNSCDSNDSSVFKATRVLYKMVSRYKKVWIEFEELEVRMKGTKDIMASHWRVFKHLESNLETSECILTRIMKATMGSETGQKRTTLKRIYSLVLLL